MKNTSKPENLTQLSEKNSTKKAPRLVLQRERVLQGFDVVTITNKQLSIQNIIHKGHKYKYYFKFKIAQAHGSIMLIFFGDDFEESLKSAKGRIKPLKEDEPVPNSIEVQGNEQSFFVRFTIRKARLPLCYEGTVGQLEFKIQCYGTIHLSKKRLSCLNKELREIRPAGLRSPMVPPESIIQSVMRPYSGGSVSPR